MRQSPSKTATHPAVRLPIQHSSAAIITSIHCRLTPPHNRLKLNNLLSYFHPSASAAARRGSHGFTIHFKTKTDTQLNPRLLAKVFLFRHLLQNAE
jgi:hypothetical protein